MGLNSRELRHKVQVQRQSGAQDGTGQKTDEWQTIRECYASIKAKTSGNTKERFKDSQFTSQVESMITVRWSRSVKIQRGDRIVYVNPANSVEHVYLVQAVTNRDQGNYALDILCWELGEAE